MKKWTYSASKNVRKFLLNGHTFVDSEARREKYYLNKDYEAGLMKNKLRVARTKCIHPLHKLEAEYNLLLKKGIIDEEAFQKAQNNIIKGLNESAINSMGRILAEIKTKSLNLDEMIDVTLSDKDFYGNFEEFYKQNFGKFHLTQKEFNILIQPYLDINHIRIYTLGKRVNHIKPANQLKSNIDHIQKISVVEEELTI